MDKTNDWFLIEFLSVVWLSSKYDSAQLSSYLFIYSFILICDLVLMKLYTYIELDYAKLK